MPRINRVIAPGLPHHITQRGNHQEKVFYRDGDRKFYLAMLTEFLPHYGVALEAYCLMSNHVHLIATPYDAKGLSAALQRVHSDYARALHLRLRQTGHLWQARFHSTVLDEKHFWTVLVLCREKPGPRRPRHPCRRLALVERTRPSRLGARRAPGPHSLAHPL